MEAPCFNSNIKVNLREVRPWHASSASTDEKILSNHKLLFWLKMGKAGVRVGQADDGGEVQVGNDRLQWQAGQRCQVHVQSSVSRLIVSALSLSFSCSIFRPVLSDRNRDIPRPIWAYLNILGLKGVMVPILFGNHLPINDWPYSKGFMKDT